MNTPIILVNFKIYDEIYGIKGLELARVCQKVSEKTGINIAIAPQVIDLRYIAEKISIPVFSQHVHNMNLAMELEKLLLKELKLLMPLELSLIIPKIE